MGRGLLHRDSKIHRLPPGFSLRFSRHNAFIRQGDRVYGTYFIHDRGDEAFVTTWSYLDMTALGRQETGEDSPDGYPQTAPYEWWDWHDEYGTHEPSRWFGDEE